MPRLKTGLFFLLFIRYNGESLSSKGKTVAARLRKTHQDDVRAKIQASQLINRLTDHALGKCDLSTTQVRAIEVLLKKTVPDLSSVELTGAGEEGELLFTVVERKIIK